MSEEKTRKKIIERCLKRTKFSAAEMEKLMRAYESTVVNSCWYFPPPLSIDSGGIWSVRGQDDQETFSTVSPHTLQHDGQSSHGPDFQIFQ